MQNQEVLDSWIGKPDAQLVAEWGLPTSRGIGMNDDFERAYFYNRCAERANSGQVFTKALAGFGDAISKSYGNNPGANSAAGIQVQQETYCDLWVFVIKDGAIVRDKVGGAAAGQGITQPFKLESGN